MSIEYFIELYEKGQLTEEAIEQMQHFAFDANDEIFIIINSRGVLMSQSD